MNKLWAYPLTIFVFAIFSAYQIYQYSRHRRRLLGVSGPASRVRRRPEGITLKGIGVLIYLTWLEWREREAQLANCIPP